MNLNFKIEKGIQMPKRGPKPTTRYDALDLSQLEVGACYLVEENVPKSKRNSTYSSVNLALKRKFQSTPGEFKVVSTKVNDQGDSDIRIFRLA